jgi:hypothetical protein
MSARAGAAVVQVLRDVEQTQAGASVSLKQATLQR